MLIGRTKELDLILQELRKPATANDLKRIVALHGMFGVGKSTLLREVIAELQSNSIVDAVLYSNEDAHIRHLPEFMYQLVNSFRACKKDIPRYKSDETDSRWMRYNELLQELEQLRTERSTGSALPESAEALSQLLKHRSADERRLMTDTASVMCETLLVDLMNTFYPLSSEGGSTAIPAAQSQRKIVIVIDTYEKMTTALNTWLLEHFLLYCYIKRFGDFRCYNSPYLSPEVFVRQYFDIRFIIAGREPLRTTDAERRWDRWQHTFLEIGLRQFGPAEIRSYFEESKIDLTSVDEVLNATAGIPYLVNLWSHAHKFDETHNGGEQTIAAHAQERIFWYKSQEQIEWIRCAAFCPWFDADLLGCFSSIQGSAQDAYSYLRRRTELCRESKDHPSKLELLPVIRDSIQHALKQESPERAAEYEQVVKTYEAAKALLAPFDQDEQEALLHLSHLHRCDVSLSLRELWASDQPIIERLLERSPGLFLRHELTISLQPDARQLLQRFISQHDPSEFEAQSTRVQSYWHQYEAELIEERNTTQAHIEKIERDILGLGAEIEKADLDRRDAHTQCVELEESIQPLRQNTPPLTTNRDAAAARIAFVLCVVVAIVTFYIHELLLYVQSTPDMEEAIQKVLLAFSIGFAILFIFFVSRSLALRRRRIQHQKNRAILADLDERYATVREKLNGCHTTLEAKKKELATLNVRLEELRKNRQRLDVSLREALL